MEDARIAEILMRLAHERAGRSFCPSEAARARSGDWRPLMDDVRRVAADLPLRATQGGEKVDARTARGPIRLSLDPGSSEGGD